MRFLNDLVQRVPTPVLAEAQFLQRLAGAAPLPGDWPSENVLLALRTCCAGQMAAVAEPCARPWITSMLSRADRLRRDGEQMLLARDESMRSGARGLLEEALRQYQAINTDVRTIEESQRCLDEMRMLLPGYPTFLEVLDERDSEAAWEHQAESARRLQEILSGDVPAVASGRDDRVREMGECTSVLRNDPNSLHRWRTPQEPERLGRLIGRRAGGDLADAREMRALLETPWPTAQQRAQLWTARGELALAIASRRIDASSVSAGEEKQALAAERRRAIRRARWSYELLRLQGGQGIDKLDMALQQAMDKPDDAERIERLALELRQAWARQHSLAAGSLP
jgi:hypothetical protein